MNWKEKGQVWERFIINQLSETLLKANFLLPGDAASIHNWLTRFGCDHLLVGT